MYRTDRIAATVDIIGEQALEEFAKLVGLAADATFVSIVVYFLVSSDCFHKDFRL